MSISALRLGMFPNKIEVEQAFKDLKAIYNADWTSEKCSTYTKIPLRNIAEARDFLCNVVLGPMNLTGRILDCADTLKLRLGLPLPVGSRTLPLSVNVLQGGGVLSIDAPAHDKSRGDGSAKYPRWKVTVPPGTKPGALLLASETGISMAKNCAESWMVVTVTNVLTDEFILDGIDIVTNLSVHSDDLENIGNMMVEGPDGIMRFVDVNSSKTNEPISEQRGNFEDQGLLKFCEEPKFILPKGKLTVTVSITKDAKRVFPFEFFES